MEVASEALASSEVRRATGRNRGSSASSCSSRSSSSRSGSSALGDVEDFRVEDVDEEVPQQPRTSAAKPASFLLWEKPDPRPALGAEQGGAPPLLPSDVQVDLRDKGDAEQTPASAQDECAICLGTAVEGDRAPVPLQLLRCSHAFCPSCLLCHTRASLAAGRGAWCPLCRERLRRDELLAIGLEENEVASAEATPEHTVPPAEEVHPTPPAAPPTWAEKREQRRAAREFRRVARRAHLKRCPNCDAIIEKNEGCDHMTCRCGHHFNWSSARTVVPCHKLHWGEEKGIACLWGRVCPGCSPVARAKLVAWRASAVTLGIPAAAAASAAAVAGAAVTAVVPAVVCAPLALAYEPVRKLRKEKKNPFRRGVSIGAEAAGMGLLVCAVSVCGGDSD